MNDDGGFVYDIPERAYHEAKAAKVLGKAVHPNALRRLFELWSDARVYVRHERPDYEGNRGAQLRCEGRSAEPWTRVVIYRESNPGRAIGIAKVAPGDQFDRRFGIQLAFRRALAKVRKQT